MEQRPLTAAEEQEVLKLLREMAQEYAEELMHDTPISGADFLDSMAPVLDLLKIELTPDDSPDDDYSPHDLQCCECGDTLNNQCLLSDCGESEDHPGDAACQECVSKMIPEDKEAYYHRLALNSL